MTERRSKPKAPASLALGGRRLWRSVVAEYNLRVDELRVLEDAARTADVVDQLAAALDGQPLTVAGSGGQPRPHPLMVEVRMQRAVLAAMLKQLGLPDPPEVPVVGEEGATASSSSSAPAASASNPRSVQARQAAMARWSRRGQS